MSGRNILYHIDNNSRNNCVWAGVARGERVELAVKARVQWRCSGYNCGTLPVSISVDSIGETHQFQIECSFFLHFNFLLVHTTLCAAPAVRRPQ